MFKKIWNKIYTWSKDNWLYLVGFIFCAVIPVVMLIELVATSDTFLGIKIGFAFCIVAVVIFFIARNQLKKLAYKFENRVIRECLLAVILAMWWGFGIGVVFGLSAIADRLGAFWWRVGLCFLIGSICYVMHAYSKQNKVGGETHEQDG
jgi:hypothetical protein